MISITNYNLVKKKCQKMKGQKSRYLVYKGQIPQALFDDYFIKTVFKGY